MTPHTATTTTRVRRPRPGRPRLIPQATMTMSPREHILDEAAHLFTSRGVTATSTREIAEAVGIRQASLYYHYANKDEILAELLQRSIRPTLDKIEKIQALCAETGAGPDVGLYLLVVLDVRTLARAPHNAGVLTRLPEVQRKEAFDPFRAARDELEAGYAHLGTQVKDVAHPTSHQAPTGDFLGTLLLQLVEVVIGVRTHGHPITPAVEAIVAASCLRICQADQSRIDAAAAWASELMRSLGASGS